MYRPKSLLMLLSLAAFASAPCIAQSICDTLQIETKEHKWSKTIDALADRGDKKGIDKAFVRQISTIVTFQRPSPRGAEGFWYGYYDGRTVLGQYSKPYCANLILKTYLCANGREVLNNGYTSSVHVYVNDLGWIGNRVTLNNKEFSTVSGHLEKRGDYYYALPDPGDKYKVEESWLLTYKDKLPFEYLTRREFLMELVAHLAAKLEKSDPALRPYIQKHLDIAQNMLQTSDEKTLALPAQVLPYGFENFEKFGESRWEPDLVYFLRNKPDYYNTSLPPSSPQYITVLIRHQKKGRANLDFYDAVNSQEMLGKLAGLLGTKQ